MREINWLGYFGCFLVNGSHLLDYVPDLIGLKRVQFIVFPFELLVRRDRTSPYCCNPHGIYFVMISLYQGVLSYRWFG